MGKIKYIGSHCFNLISLTVYSFTHLIFRGLDRKLDFSGLVARPKDKIKAQNFYRDYARKNQGYEGAVNRGIFKYIRMRERKALLDLLNLERGEGSIIDVGCGPGFYSLKAKDRGWNVTSVDALPEMVEPLKLKVDRVLVADLEHLEIDMRFDLVICLGALDFVTDPSEAFRRLSRLLAPGGHMVIYVPRASLGGMIYRFEKLLMGMHTNLFSRAWFLKMADANQLSVVKECFPLPTNMALRFSKR